MLCPGDGPSGGRRRVALEPNYPKNLLSHNILAIRGTLINLPGITILLIAAFGPKSAEF